MTRFLSAIALLIATSSAGAAPVDYVFDSLTRFDMHTSRPSVTGILQGGSTPTTVDFADSTNGEYRYGVSRCVPVLLTMMEKPGRYVLHLTVDSAATNVGLISCGLELRN